jgi:hypothetical protein
MRQLHRFFPEKGTNLRRQRRLSAELSFASMQASEVIGALPPLNGCRATNTVSGIRNPGVISSYPYNHTTVRLIQVNQHNPHV